MRFRLQTAPPLSSPRQYMYGVPEADPVGAGLAHPGATILDLLNDMQARLPGLGDTRVHLSLNGFVLLDDQPFRTLIGHDELLTLTALPQQEEEEDIFCTPKATKTLVVPLHETPVQSTAKGVKRPRDMTTEKTTRQPRCSVCRLRGHFRKVCPSARSSSDTRPQPQEDEEESACAVPLSREEARASEVSPTREEADPRKGSPIRKESREATEPARVLIPSAYRHKKKQHNVTQHQKAKAAPHKRFTQALPSPAASPTTSQPIADMANGPLLQRPIQFQMLHLSPTYEPELKVFRGKFIHFDPATDTADLLLDDDVLAEPAPVYDEDGERVWRKFELPSEETHQAKNVMQLFWSDVHQPTYLT